MIVHFLQGTGFYEGAILQGEAEGEGKGAEELLRITFSLASAGKLKHVVFYYCLKWVCDVFPLASGGAFILITSGLLKPGIRVILGLLCVTQFLTFKICSYAALGCFYSRKLFANREFFILLYTFRFLLMTHTKEELI